MSKLEITYMKLDKQNFVDTKAVNATLKAVDKVLQEVKKEMQQIKKQKPIKK